MEARRQLAQDAIADAACLRLMEQNAACVAERRERTRKCREAHIALQRCLGDLLGPQSHK